MLEIEDLGVLSYEDARARQLDRVARRVRDEVSDALLLLEHEPVVTLGRGSDAGNLKDPHRFPVVESERGGDVTLHAPGQLVGYVIQLLPEGRRDLHAHLRRVEEVIINGLGDFGLVGGRRDGATGVWVAERKIASLGVACRQWCTWHGFALNVSIPLHLFDAINPCGFDAEVMTSMERELAGPVDMTDVKRAIINTARTVLRFTD